MLVAKGMTSLSHVGAVRFQDAKGIVCKPNHDVGNGDSISKAR